MTRRRKGSDLAFIEAMVSLAGIALVYIYLKDPNLGRGLMQIIPKLVVGVIGLGLFLVMAWFLISFGSKSTRENVILESSRGDTAVLPRSSRVNLIYPELRVEPPLTLEQKLERIDWFQFEQVIAMLYRSRGCVVDRRGGANPDGGIDLIVETGGEKIGVQCKFWKAYEVGVRQVRELMGALQDQGIPKGRVVSFKGFTDPARELAARNGIELVGKSAIIAMLQEARYTPHSRELNTIMDSEEKRCPKCERQMVKRTSKKDGNQFWGCSGFPRCRYTLDV